MMESTFGLLHPFLLAGGWTKQNRSTFLWETVVVFRLFFALALKAQSHLLLTLQQIFFQMDQISSINAYFCLVIPHMVILRCACFFFRETDTTSRIYVTRRAQIWHKQISLVLVLMIRVHLENLHKKSCFTFSWCFPSYILKARKLFHCLRFWDNATSKHESCTVDEKSPGSKDSRNGQNRCTRRVSNQNLKLTFLHFPNLFSFQREFSQFGSIFHSV